MELMSTNFGKYIASFDYFHKSLIVLSVTGSLYIKPFASVLEAPVGTASANFSPAFSISTGIVKKMLKTTINKKKQNKIVMLGRSKLNTIESQTSDALINSEISNEDFMAIITKKKIEK